MERRIDTPRQLRHPFLIGNIQLNNSLFSILLNIRSNNVIPAVCPEPLINGIAYPA
ncbi:hypothetical protein D3C81_2235370 [compost metagenome]